ncbi:response regulator [Vibrio sp.]|uniref:response regulator n=1 Tax=Vibrio sp. TaxID=678 RepID=UPI003F6D1EF2
MFDQKMNALIIDDSPVILTNISRMLSRMGFREENIHFSQNPKAAVTLSRRIPFDVILCDFNFGEQINGKQVLEELIHFSSMSDSCVFMIITGDSSTQTFNSLFEITMDDYILKPFNYNDLKKRIERCIEKRSALEGIYKLKRLGRYTEALELCEQFLSTGSKYSNFLKREKGKFLRLLKRWGKAQHFYTELYFSESADWVAVGLVNALKNNGELKKARALVQSMLKENPHHIDAKKEFSGIEMAEGNIKASIGHLVDINKLTRENSERNLIISNLFLYMDDFYQAKLYYAKFRESNKDTYRDDHWMDMNYLRRALMYLSFDDDDVELELCQSIFTHLYHGKDVSATCLINLDILMSHFLFIKGEYKEAASLLNQSFNRIYDSKDIQFYDLFYMYWLLVYLSYDSTYQSIADRMETAFVDIIQKKSSKHHSELLIDSLELLHEKSHQYYTDKQQALTDITASAKHLEKIHLIQDFIVLAKKYPTLLSLRIEILKLLKDTWPVGHGKRKVSRFLGESDNIIRSFSSDDDLQKIGYEMIYTHAKKGVEDQAELATS